MGGNPSGLRPCGYKVVVSPRDVEEKTKGGLFLPDEVKEKEEFGRTEGIIVAASPMAFRFDDWPEGVDTPKVNDRVMFSKYNATEFLGQDGAKYWVMEDKAIIGVME